ncbi:MAG: DUF2971 domain-containing protein [Methylophilus sp.]|uniref:DUF2971 domain-containing protein n=1 Tax=Methylophilus sp. TaxID=29541 RepID=UPI004034F751
MRYPTVKNLYKYRSLRTRRGSKSVRDSRLVSAISDEAIWISKPNAFNDPFDCNLRPLTLGLVFEKRLADHFANVEANVADYAKLLSDNVDAVDSLSQETIEKVLNTILSNDAHRDLFRKWGAEEVFDSLWGQFKNKIESLGILCLSEHPDNPLLWAHYADEHRGFCIEFERSDKNMLGDGKYTYPVKYSNKYPEITMSDLFEFNNIDQGNGKSLEETCVGSVLLTKSEHWAYENEWRLIGEGNNMLTDYPGKITSIIFGLRMPEKDRKFLKKLYGKDIIYRQAVMQKGMFSILIDDYPSKDEY